MHDEIKVESKKRTTKRRGNGEGSIYQRVDGRWCATVTIGYSATAAGVTVRHGTVIASLSSTR